jgi:hypothetical protein
VDEQKFSGIYIAWGRGIPFIIYTIIERKGNINDRKAIKSGRGI